MMNKYIKKCLVCCGMMATMILASCELEQSDNGKLDGFWLLSSVDTLSTGHTADVSAEELTWSFQGRLLQLRKATLLYYKFPNYILRFESTSNSLTLSNPIYNDRDEGDPDVEDIEELRPFGINDFEEHFTIVTLTNSRLVLKNDRLQLKLRK